MREGIKTIPPKDMDDRVLERSIMLMEMRECFTRATLPMTSSMEREAFL